MESQLKDPVRLVLADDHLLIRSGIARLLNRVPQVSVVAEASNGKELVAMVESLRPDLVMTDLDMPEMDGIEATREILQRQPGAKVILLSMMDELDYVRRAVANGACGYLLKDASADELRMAVQWAVEKGSYFSPTIAQKLLVAPPSLQDQLTPRQLEILKRMVDGQSTKEIAYALGLSIKTVDVHRAEIMKRAGVTDLASLTRAALRTGLIKP